MKEGIYATNIRNLMKSRIIRHVGCLTVKQDNFLQGILLYSFVAVFSSCFFLSVSPPLALAQELWYDPQMQSTYPLCPCLEMFETSVSILSSIGYKNEVENLYFGWIYLLFSHRHYTLAFPSVVPGPTTKRLSFTFQNRMDWSTREF